MLEMLSQAMWLHLRQNSPLTLLDSQSLPVPLLTLRAPPVWGGFLALNSSPVPAQCLAV